jgi:hypothetical protein
VIFSKDSSIRRAVLFPNHYCWYVLASSLDIFLTYVIIEHFHGWEVNRLADALINRFSEWGLIGLKFSTVMLVIVICEFIGRRTSRVARRLATAAVCLAALPVGIGMLQISAWLFGVDTLLGTPEPGIVTTQDPTHHYYDDSGH